MSRYIDADKLIHHLEDEIKGCEPPFGGRANVCLREHTAQMQGLT